MKVWDEGTEDFRTLLANDPEVSGILTEAHLDSLFDYSFYTRHVDTILARQED
jgi:adenylosuccinate lyase